MGTIANPLQTTKENPDFGEAVSALAVLSHNSEVQTAIQATNFLAALAGPRGGLVGLGGEVHPIGSSMISVGDDSAEQARLTELLFAPLRFLQVDLIDYSARVDPKLRNRLATSLADPHCKDYGGRRAVVDEVRVETELKHATGQAQKSAQMVSSSHPVDRYENFKRDYSMTEEERARDTRMAEESPFAKINYETMLEYNEARCLCEPLVFLENPDSQLLQQGMGEVDRQSPLVLDSESRLLARVFAKNPDKVAEVVEGLLSGRGTRATSKVGARPSRGILYSVADRTHLAQWISTPESGRLLRRTLLVDPTSKEEDGGNTFDLEVIRRGYDQFRKAVKGVLRLRRLDAPGIAPILDNRTAEKFFHAQRNFHQQIGEVEPRLKPFAANFVHLPATMLWSLEKLCEGRETQDLLPMAIYLADSALHTHLNLVETGLDTGKLQRLEEECRKMLRKLYQSEPCRFRELQRKYDVQRKSILEPVLEHLIETNRVQKIEKGILRTTERGRSELAGIGDN